MAISDMFKKNIVKSAKFKEMQENFELQKKLEERQKNSNERELERFYEEERQKTIARNLEEFRKRHQKEAMKTTVLGGKPLFKGKGNLMNDKMEVLQNNHKLLSMSPTVKSKGMFFK